MGCVQEGQEKISALLPCHNSKDYSLSELFTPHKERKLQRTKYLNCSFSHTNVKNRVWGFVVVTLKALHLTLVQKVERGCVPGAQCCWAGRELKLLGCLKRGIAAINLGRHKSFIPAQRDGVQM